MGGSGIVGDLDALEADGFGHPMPPTAWGTRVAVDLLVLVGQHFSPAHFVPLPVDVLVPTAADGCCSDVDVIFPPGFQALHGDRQSGE